MAQTPPIKLEAEFTLTLAVQVKGYGTEEQKNQTASEVKRLLEVGFQREIHVYVVHASDIMRHNGEVKRIDRNAKQARGEV